jgi:hypothetical protein
MKKKNSKEEEKIRTIGYIFIWTIVFLVVFYSIFVAINRMNNFEYNGLAFSKQKFGSLDVYYYYYFFKGLDGNMIKYDLYLREDPRKNNIPVETNISLSGSKRVYISLDTDRLVECEDSQLGISEISLFLAGNEFKLYTGTTNFTASKELKVEHITCENTAYSNTIIMQRGNESRIYREKDKCYIIQINDCKDVVKASERFILQLLINGKQN